MRIVRLGLIGFFLVCMVLGNISIGVAYSGESLAVIGKVTLLQLGSDLCLPCKMMKPILEKVKKEFPKDLNVVTMDVYKDRALAAKYSVRVIPTHIFFDREGNEVMRHSGYMTEQDLRNALKKLGVSK